MKTTNLKLTKQLRTAHTSLKTTADNYKSANNGTEPEDAEVGKSALSKLDAIAAVLNVGEDNSSYNDLKQVWDCPGEDEACVQIVRRCILQHCNYYMPLPPSNWDVVSTKAKIEPIAGNHIPLAHNLRARLKSSMIASFKK